MKGRKSLVVNRKLAEGATTDCSRPFTIYHSRFTKRLPKPETVTLPYALPEAQTHAFT